MKIYCQLGAVVKADLQTSHDLVRWDGRQWWEDGPEEIRSALAGTHKDLVLWEVVVHNRALHLHFCDCAEQMSARHAISGSIKFEEFYFLEMDLVAEPFKDLEPARQLHCNFGFDPAWGNFVDLTEYREGHGVHKFIVYPDARSEQFEKISEY